MKPEIIKLIEENPELPIVPMVDSEVVADDGGYWLGKWKRCEVTEYYQGREYIHFRDDDEEIAEIAQNVQNGDLILRKAAIESIRECAEVAHDNREWGMEQGYLNAIECVEEEPPAQPEIIRCKDCKHWRFDHTCREHSLVSPMMANEFCSRAERREG